MDIELENCEKEILYHIMLKDNSFINIKYFTQSNFEILKKVINTETKKTIPNEIISFLLDNEQITLSEKVMLIYKSIFLNDIENSELLEKRIDELVENRSTPRQVAKELTGLLGEYIEKGEKSNEDGL